MITTILSGAAVSIVLIVAISAVVMAGRTDDRAQKARPFVERKRN